jgi:D-sedoheptulose 7-phosphate isomerase
MSRLTDPAEELAPLFAAALDEHIQLAYATRDMLMTDTQRMLALWIACVQRGGKILFFGNGGSATQAQHFAAELVVRISASRAALPAIALAADSAILTAAGNDFGFETIFSRQIEAIGLKGDLAVGLSTSGNSPNVVKALDSARSRGLSTAALLGSEGGAAAKASDISIIVPSRATARIQEMHLVLGHMLCTGLERAVASP